MVENDFSNHSGVFEVLHPATWNSIQKSVDCVGETVTAVTGKFTEMTTLFNFLNIMSTLFLDHFDMHGPVRWITCNRNMEIDLRSCQTCVKQTFKNSFKCFLV